jgi:branched-chain amino acid transport system permease protein
LFIQLIINGIIAGSIYALIALGFALIYYTVRFFHFAHGAVYTLAAYLVYLFFHQLHINFIISVIISILLTGITGCLIELFIYRPLRKKKATSLVFLISSMGLYIVIQNIISLCFGDDTKTVRTKDITEGYSLLGAYITPIQIIILITTIVLFLFIAILLKHTRLGKGLRAVANNPELAKIVGLPLEKIFLFTFFIGSMLAGTAAILISLDTDMIPTMGFSALFMSVIAVIIGGSRNISGVLLGGIFLGLIENISVWKIPSQWQECISFIILLLFLFIKPKGIFSVKNEKAEI